MIELNEIITKNNFDVNKLRLNIGGGSERYSNCINLELTAERNNDVDVFADIKKGLPFKENTFSEILMIHVIEHIEKKFHKFVINEIWRVLKPDCRLVMSFPDTIECMKAFIENRFGARWEMWELTIFGRQDGTGDYHVCAMEQQDITNKLFSCGFKDVNYCKNRTNVIITARKGEKLTKFLM